MSEDAPIRILGVAGSLREASYSRRLVRLAAELSAELEQPVEFVEFDALRDIEHFDEDLEPFGVPNGVRAWRDALADTDAVLIATPEYNASIPGTLKNALDWASRADDAPYRDLPRSGMYGMPVAVISSSTGQFGGAWARDELAKSLRTQGARVVRDPSVAVPNAETAFTADGDLVSATQRDKLRDELTVLVESARMVRTARLANRA